MPASQLKQLKASLRESGIVGPQRSKKQKKKGARPDQRKIRDEALSNIREVFNPFDKKAASRPNKRDVTTAQTMKAGGKAGAAVYGRPGVTKSAGEEMRRKMLLPEIQNRHKVGGILDKRIGESDPNMTPEERMQQRFAREQERKSKKHAMFDLEQDEEDMLTHGGRLIEAGVDDFDTGSISGSSDDDDTGGLLKRKREAIEAMEEIVAAGEEEPDRKKSKAEVMKEVMAKSKLHKYERQQAKEDDEDIREELDKGVGDLRAALFSFQNSLVKRKDPLLEKPGYAPADGSSAPNGLINPGRAALMEAQIDPDKNYDVQIKKLAQDRKARVTDRTKTEEEHAAEIAEKQKEIEEGRLRRMKGEEDEEKPYKEVHFEDEEDVEQGDEEDLVDDAADFGFSNSHISKSHTMDRPPGFEDEDQFVIDEDLVASGSEFDEDALDEESVDGEFVDEMMEAEDDTAKNLGRSITGANHMAVSTSKLGGCPETYDELVTLFESGQAEGVHSIIRRMRLKYDASLSSTNKAKLEAFALVMVEYLGTRPNSPASPPLESYESIIRHLQSMSRTFVVPIARAFRSHLERMHKEQTMTPGDLMVLTAIGTIYPTSDHFHQVVTPAMTLMARWLGLTTPKTTSEFSTGVYLCTLALKYQAFSKRYVPELVRFTVASLKANPLDAIKKAHLDNVRTMIGFWSGHSAFIEIFTPTILPVLKEVKAQTLVIHLNLHLAQSAQLRKPLALHHHKPQPIKSAIPKFEDNFNPDRHYDPDRERADSARLKKEYKREKKGAVRELRKDANFLAREGLKEKKERDRAYEDKYRKLVAEIQGEEGREANAYEREKRGRKGRGKD